MTTLGEQATASIVVLENTKTLRPTTFKILKQMLVVQIIITIANGDVKPDSQVKSFNGANGNKICGGDNRKSGNEMLEKTFNSVPSGYYHLDFDYYKVDSWDGNEYGYVKINDITCWRRTKNSVS